MEITDKSNLDKIAIVVIGYNRLGTTSKLLDSLNRAEYNKDDVPLVISIDKSGNEELYDYVKSFSWKHGEKYVIIREEKLGLERHIFECGNLSQNFRAVIILEDDVIVAPGFYSYFESTVRKYENEDKIACISAYCNYLNGYVGLPFIPMKNDDVFAIQEVSSTGECFTRRMWKDFYEWKCANTPFNFNSLEVPDKIKRWKDAWTKYFNAYMVLKDKYCIYPNYSTITNSGAAGVHNSHSETLVQTVLCTKNRSWIIPSFGSLTKYDIFGNNKCLYEALALPEGELCLDMYGNNPNNLHKRYILSVNRLPYKIVRGFELSYRPHELNIILGVNGDDIRLYDTSVVDKNNKRGGNYNIIGYYLYGFHPKLLPCYVTKSYFRILQGKIRKFLKKRA